MAVSDPQQINLAPYFSNITDIIRRQAELYANRPPTTSEQIGQALGQGLGSGIAMGAKSSIETKQAERLAKLESDLQLERTKKLAEFESQIKKEIPKEQRDAIDKLKENIGKPGYPTEAQYYMGLAGGPDVWKQMAQYIFPDSSKRPQFLRDPDRGITYQVTGEGNLIPVFGAKKEGIAKNLDDFEKNDRTEFVKARTSFQSNVVNKYRETFDAAMQVENALKSKNPILDVGVRAKMAKAFGDSGNLAVIEQEQYGGSPELRAWVEEMVSKKFEGVMSEKNREFLKKAAKVLQGGSVENFNSAVESEAISLSDTYNADIKFAEKYLAGSLSKYLYPSFDSIEEAEKMKLPIGSIIKINGKRAIVE